MRYEDFRTEVKENILSYLGDTIENPTVSILPKQKNNGELIYGLSIRSETASEIITPVLYLDRYYQRFEEGETMESVMKQLAHDYAEVYKSHDIDDTRVNDFLDYDYAKDHVLPRLVNYEMNEDRLKTMPHTKYLDLAVTYHITIHADSDGIQSIPITNDLLDKFGITTDDLHEQSMTNLSKSEPVIQSMQEIMQKMFCDDPELGALALGEDIDPPMLVISNNTNVYGAAEILNDSVTEALTERLGGDFFVLPSSVHEVLAIPVSEDFDPTELASMITGINNDVVKNEEVLSNHAYVYDSKRHELLPAFGQDHELNETKDHQQDKVLSIKPDDPEPVQGLEHPRRQLIHGR